MNIEPIDLPNDPDNELFGLQEEFCKALRRSCEIQSSMDVLDATMTVMAAKVVLAKVELAAYILANA